MPAPQHSLFIPLARLLRPQGRRGELLADLLTEATDLLGANAGVFLVAAGKDAPADNATRVHLEAHWMPTGKNAGRVVVKLPGCDSINDAERLAGSTLMIPAEERPALEADTFYVSDLIGASLYDGDVLAGEVVDVEFATSPDGKTRLAEAAPLLCIAAPGAAPDAEPLLIPFVNAHLRSVDIAGRRIVMDLPPGLLSAEV